MTKINFRKLHRITAPILFLPLLLSALTGIIFIVGDTLFGESDTFEELILGIHEGKFLGKHLVPFYVLLVGLGLISMLITGMIMYAKKNNSYLKALTHGKWNFRFIHRFLAPILLIPLLISATTGMAYRIGRAWFNLPKEKIEILMDIHQGSYFGSFLQVVYVLLIGLGLITIVVSGMQMTGIFRKRISRI